MAYTPDPQDQSVSRRRVDDPQDRKDSRHKYLRLKLVPTDKGSEVRVRGDSDRAIGKGNSVEEVP
jgi:hypothetical protein